MRRRDLLAGSLAFVAAPAIARPVMPLRATPREMLSPPFVDGTGRDLTLADFRGRVLLLNVWATWCAPCREEMPTLDALEARLGGADFHVLPLSIDRAGLGPVRRFYEEIGIEHLAMYLAEDIRAMAALAVAGLPTTILIDRQGRELGRLSGPADWNSAENVALFETIITKG
ncbi:TlpA disulfide reductase family protein [Roseovarius sp. MBR-6]|jgi:thiol-disulfide isomerase/thioredoxin|uniref:TlpA family protein disulfide reductase n=1 Tax=Roseovarius sp. MBR-6 TaxID=3156459 RepID=UPI00339A68E7